MPPDRDDRDDDDDRPTAPQGRTRLGIGARAADGPKRAPTATGSDLIGARVAGRYVIEGELGAGAFGKVYRGRHAVLGRAVAIKVLHPHLVHEPVILQRFQREAQLAARLSHPNVAAVLDVGETPDGRHMMVLEFAEGVRLTELLDAPLPRARVIALVRQLLLGLEHAHGVGLIHRDLKPDNVMVERRPDGSERARIVDFGIAVVRDPENPADAGRLTATGEMIGTPLYMAPEQAKCEPFDHRADLFALGVIVYEMLAAEVPFEGSSIEVALANINRDPPPIASRAPGVAADPLLEAFGRRLMARDLAVRLPSARAALDLLELIERDPAAAWPSLGRTDVDRAASVVALPGGPRRV